MIEMATGFAQSPLTYGTAVSDVNSEKAAQS
jgi:hypothetical protein